MVDKAEAKEYTAEIIGHEHIIPTLGVWDSFDEIDFDSLPFQFVLKTTHDSGGVVICRDKSNFDLTAARRKLNKSLRHNFFLDHREYPYKNVKPRIIAEQYMEDEDGKGLKDYKFFCFNGEPRMMFIATNRPVDTRFDFFDMDFNHLPFAQGHPWADGPLYVLIFMILTGKFILVNLLFSISQAIVLFRLLNGMKGLVAGGLWKNSFLGNTLRHLLSKSQTSLM